MKVFADPLAEGTPVDRQNLLCTADWTLPLMKIV